MDVVHPRCAGMDISKWDAKVCVRVQGSGRTPTSATVTTWGAMTSQILALREHLTKRNDRPALSAVAAVTACRPARPVAQLPTVPPAPPAAPSHPAAPAVSAVNPSPPLAPPRPAR